MRKIITLSCIFLFFISTVHGQDKSFFIRDDFFTINNNYLPKDLLKTKSIVLIKISDGDGKRGNWKKLANEIHYYLRRRGIDPVWYFYFDDIYAGPDLSKSITNALVTREVNNIIIYNRKAELDYDFYITTFTQNPFFFKRGQEMLKIRASTPAQINRELAKLIDLKDLVRENLMILETPEYFNQMNLIHGKRFQHYAADLKLDKLAIPDFKNLENEIVPINLPGMPGGKTPTSGQSEINNELRMIFKKYPFQHDFIEYNFDESAIRKKGYQFVLLWLHGTESSIQKMLNYSLSMGKENESNVITQKTNKTTGRLVYKFYIKHIYTGDVYLGNTWDADTNWQKALQRHLDYLIEQAK